MSDLHRAVQAEIELFRPDRIPPFEGLVARRRARRAKAWRGGAALAVVVVGLGASGGVALHGRHGGGDPNTNGSAVRGGDAGLGPAVDASLPDLRPLPTGALLQTSYTGGHAIGPQPAIPQIGLRLYDDGTLLSPNGKNVGTRWQQVRLTTDKLNRVRKLIAQAGLAAGGRDYGTPTNAGFAGLAVVFQIDGQAGVVASTIEYGGTVNGIPTSDTGLTEAQRRARQLVQDLTNALAAAQNGASAAYTPTQWSRYAQPSPKGASIDVAASPRWNGSTGLDTGEQYGGGLRCVAVTDPARNAGRRYFDAQYRVGDTVWEVRYDEVLPGEDPCTASTT